MMKNIFCRLLCLMGFHAFHVVEVTLGFGPSGAVEKVECRRTPLSDGSTDEDQDDREDVRRHCREEGGGEAERTAGGSAPIAKPKGRPSDTEERHEKRYHG